MFKFWPYSCFHTYLTYRTKQVVTYTSKNLQGATFDMRTMKSIVKVNKFMWSPLSLAAGSSRSYLQQDFDLKSRCRQLLELPTARLNGDNKKVKDNI